jgi:hypothetical protein
MNSDSARRPVTAWQSQLLHQSSQPLLIFEKMRRLVDGMWLLT